MQYTLPDGKTTYAEYDPKINGFRNAKFAYPLNEYKWDIPKHLIINEKIYKGKAEGDETGKEYLVKDINLKFGKLIRQIFDNGVLVDITLLVRHFINDSEKIINILDYTNDTTIL